MKHGWIKLVGLEGYRSLSLVALAVSGYPAVGSAQVECRHLVVQLQEMQKAQGVLLNSFVGKNLTTANVFDLYSEQLSAPQNSGTLTKATQGLKQSAEAFRGHAERERVLVAKFQGKSEELVRQISQCLTAH